MYSKPKQWDVVIVGAGLTGLAAATVLTDRGYRVLVVEATQRAGGKAYGYLDRRTGLPREHSVRVLVKYATLLRFLQRIPAGDKGRTVLDNVTPVDVWYAAPDTHEYLLFPDASRSHYAAENAQALFHLQHVFRLPLHDLATLSAEYAKYKLLPGYATTLARQTFQEALLRKLSGAGAKFTSDLAQFLVAAKPTACALAMYQELFDMVGPGRPIPPEQHTSYAMFNAPTSEAMVDPWVRWLREDRGVTFVFGHRAQLVTAPDGKRAVALEGGPPIDARAALFAVSLHSAQALSLCPQIPATSAEEWSNGIQFYLGARPPRYPAGMVVCMMWTSEWHVSLGVQDKTLWPGVALPPGVGCVVSATFTNANVPGRLFGKTVKECDERELVAEMMAQSDIPEGLVVGYRLDDNLYRNAADTAWINEMPLFIVTPETWPHLSDDGSTAWPNIFVAGEFTRTDKRTPSMEKAAEAGTIVAHSIDAYLSPSLPASFCG